MWHDDRVAMINYYLTEMQAPEGGRNVAPAAVAAVIDEWRALLCDVRSLDLAEPWPAEPGTTNGAALGANPLSARAPRR